MGNSRPDVRPISNVPYRLLLTDARPSAPVPRHAVTRRRRPEAQAFLELSALCGLAIAQPLLDIIGNNPDFLLFHGAGMAETLLLLATLVAVPPVLLWGIGAAFRPAGARARHAVHVVLVSGLLAVLAVQVGKHLSTLRGIPLAVLAAGVGLVGAVACARLAVLGRILRVAAAGPLVFVLLFVFASPGSTVVLGARDTTPVARAAGVGPHPPIVMIIFDELPLVSLLDSRGRVDARRLPNFAKLAAGSTWMRNATTVSLHTKYAVPAMLTGRYADDAIAPHYSRYRENLFTLLDGEYDIHAWETVTQLCPPASRDGGGRTGGGFPVLVEESASLLGKLASPYDSEDDPTAAFREPTVADRRRDKPVDYGPDFRMAHARDNQPARFAEFADAVRRPATPGRPELRFLHLLVPHSPWRYLASGTGYDGPPHLPWDGPWWARIAHQRHLQQVGYADLLLGETLRALERSGAYRESLIVVAADHGDSFSEGVAGREMDVGLRAAAELAWVPLFIKAPGQVDGEIDDRDWQHVDLLPTIADHAGVRLPWPVDGVSALDRPAGPTPGRAIRRVDRDAGIPLRLDPADHFPAVLRGPAARPVLPEMPSLALVGRRVADLPVARGGARAVVANRPEFDRVRPTSGELPALVHGVLPRSTREGTPIAIALNGRIGAVALAATDRAGDRRLVGLITDESLFVPGANTLRLYEVSGSPDRWRLTRLADG